MGNDGIMVTETTVEDTIPREAVVTVTVHVAGQTKTWSAEGSGNGDRYKVARGLLAAVNDDARNWLIDQQN